MNVDAGGDVLELKAPAAKYWEARLSLSADKPRTLRDLGFESHADLEDAQVELGKIERSITTADENKAWAEAEIEEADSRITKSEREIVNAEAKNDKSEVEKANANLEKAKAEAEKIRPIAESHKAVAKKDKATAEKALAEAKEALEKTEKLLATQNKKSVQKIGGFRNIVKWSLWPGATVLVVGGLLALAFQWRTLGRTFASIFASFGSNRVLKARSITSRSP